MNDEHPVFCGKCGTPNPADNTFCRKCGHVLADDVIEIEGSPPPASPRTPVPGVEIQRFPLVDPDTGEAFDLPPSAPTGSRQTAHPPRRGNVILWSFAIHFIIISLLAMAALMVLNQLGLVPSEEAFEQLQAQVTDLQQRREANQISAEAASLEGQRMLERHGFAQMMKMVAIPLLAGFFLSGLLAGRFWRPKRTLDVTVASMVFGGLCVLCVLDFWVWPAAVALSVVGTLLGRRWR